MTENSQSNFETFQNPISNPLTPKFYCNSFFAGFNATDVFIISTVNGAPNLILNLPYPVAKMLAQALSGIIGEHEKQLATSIKSLSELQTIINDYQAKKQ
jgi:hypothetical protein